VADIRATVHFSGRVQQVGFRYTTLQVSRHYDVVGTVENLPDGRVRMIAEGAEQTIRQMADDIAQHPGIRVTEARWELGVATGEFAGFKVLG